jgi:hypothetical protein
MLQTISAMFIRALRGHFRNRSFAWARVAFAIVVLCVMLLQSLVEGGIWFLSCLFGLNVVSILIATAGFFASAITEEKDEGTLPLLLMAGASPLSVLLGKTATRIFEGVLFLAIQVPFAMLAVTLGGVMLEQVFAGYAALAAFLFFCACMASLGSVLARSHALATVVAFAGIAITFVLIPALGYRLPVPGSLRSAMDRFPIWSRLSDILELTFAGGIAGPEFYLPVALGLIVFLIAWALFARFPDGIGTADGIGIFAKLAGPELIPRPAFTGALAIEWKDHHFIHGGARKRRLKAWLYCGIVIIIALVVSDSWVAFISGIGIAAVWVGAIAMLVEMCVAAARMYRAEIYEKTLSTLLTVPFLTIEGIDFAKLAAAKNAYTVSAKLFGAGVFFSFLILPVIVNPKAANAGVFLATFALPMLLAPAAPALFIYVILLRQVLVRCSLNMAWGAVPTAVGITFAAILTITGLVSLVVGLLEYFIYNFSVFAFFGPLLALIPIFYLAKWVKKGNIKRLYELAAEER